MKYCAGRFHAYPADVYLDIYVNSWHKEHSMFFSRVVQDRVALGLHCVVLGITLCVHPSFVLHTSGLLLVLMECVAIVAHVFYCYALTDARRCATCQTLQWWYKMPTPRQNPFRWAEYAVSATIGGLAVYTSTDSNSTNVVLLLCVMGVAQQVGGLTIDTPPETDVTAAQYLTAFMCGIVQLAEFAVVASVGVSAPLMVTYVTQWSLFGVHAYCKLFVQKLRCRSMWNQTGFVECVYSILGYTAKLAVYTVAYCDETNSAWSVPLATFWGVITPALLLACYFGSRV